MGFWARFGAATAIAMMALGAAPATARAESLPRLIPRLIEKGLLRKNPNYQPPLGAAERAHLEQGVPAMWIGSTFHVSIVARDWQEAYSITDGHPLVFDRVRLIRSSRMAVTRLSLTEGRITPFAEISLGQWRVDPDLMPILPRATELAGQIAVGFELRLATRCAVAWDIERTSIYRDPRDVQQVPVSALLGTFAALRAEF